MKDILEKKELDSDDDSDPDTADQGHSCDDHNPPDLHEYERLQPSS